MTAQATAPSCFVVMPFDPDYEGVFNAAIRPAVEANGFRCQRADSSTIPQNLPSEIVKAIIAADLVVADLSEPNPNVFYEVGISHCVGNKTIAITSKVDALPFDLAAWRAIVYRNDPAELSFLRLKLDESIKSLVAADFTVATNLVQEAGRDFFNTRLRIEEHLGALQTTIERIERFSEFTSVRSEPVDNSSVVESVALDVRRSLVGGKKLVVSLTGPGAIGKSTFASQLSEALLEDDITSSVMPTDAYMMARGDRIHAGLIGFDIAANDVSAMVSDVRSLLSGRPIEVARYDHATGKHQTSATVEPADVLIVEGIHSFYPGIHVGPETVWLKYYFYAAPNHARELKFIADFMERRYDLQSAYQHSLVEYDAYEAHVLPYIRHADRVVEVDGYWRYTLREPL